MQEFQRQAVSLAEWDKRILANAERVATLNGRVTEIEQMQRGAEQGVAYVTAQQAELEALLDGIERELPNMVTALGKTPLVGADADRNRTFELAESVQLQLNDVSTQLSQMVDQVNNAAVSVPPPVESSNSVEITQILNNHVDVLAWIEGQITTLQKSALDVQKMSDRAHLEQERFHLSRALN